LSNYKPESFRTARLLGTEERKIEVWWRQVKEEEIWEGKRSTDEGINTDKEYV